MRMYDIRSNHYRSTSAKVRCINRCYREVWMYLEVLFKQFRNIYIIIVCIWFYWNLLSKYQRVYSKQFDIWQ